jgi:hypothetical protein
MVTHSGEAEADLSRPTGTLKGKYEKNGSFQSHYRRDIFL